MIGWQASREGVCVVSVGLLGRESKTHTDIRGIGTPVFVRSLEISHRHATR